MNENLLHDLTETFPIITYKGQVEFLDEQNQPHLFDVLEAYNARMIVDQIGYFWMNEAEMSRVLQVKEETIYMAVNRYIKGQKGKITARSFSIKAPDTLGRYQMMSFYNIPTVIGVILRMNDDLLSPQALDFLGHLFEWHKWESRVPQHQSPPSHLNQRPCGVVYIISNGEHYKIGISRQLETRLKTLQLQAGELEVIHTIVSDQYFALERKLHEYFRDRHIHQEWFALTPEDIQWVKATYP